MARRFRLGMKGLRWLIGSASREFPSGHSDPGTGHHRSVMRQEAQIKPGFGFSSLRDDRHSRAESQAGRDCVRS